VHAAACNKKMCPKRMCNPKEGCPHGRIASLFGSRRLNVAYGQHMHQVFSEQQTLPSILTLSAPSRDSAHFRRPLRPCTGRD
jgi:hypothetical protein